MFGRGLGSLILFRSPQAKQNLRAKSKRYSISKLWNDVAAILVREGGRVEAGQPVIELETTRSGADLFELQVRLANLAIMFDPTPCRG